MTHFTKEYTDYNYRFTVALLRNGWNEIILKNEGEQPLSVVALKLVFRVLQTI